jgi:hypothetical protein
MDTRIYPEKEGCGGRLPIGRFWENRQVKIREALDKRYKFAIISVMITLMGLASPFKN